MTLRYLLLLPSDCVNTSVSRDWLLKCELVSCFCSVSATQRTALAAPGRRNSTAVQAMPIAELANEFTEITGYATVMFAITLVVNTCSASCGHTAQRCRTCVRPSGRAACMVPCGSECCVFVVVVATQDRRHL